jgi:1-carboxybiuret hydrolase subunit AtzG-like protein
MKRKKTVKKARAAKPPARGRAKAAATPKAKTATKAKPVPARSKAAQPDMLDAMLTAGAEALNLPLDPAWRGGVKFNLGLILRLGALVDSFALSDDTEPGPVFHA